MSDALSLIRPTDSQTDAIVELPIHYFSGNKHVTLQTAYRLPPHELGVDETRFLSLLAASVSLSIEEKMRILQAMPGFEQNQVDELLGILETEAEQFSELPDEHKPQMDKMQDQCIRQWLAWERDHPAKL